MSPRTSKLPYFTIIALGIAVSIQALMAIRAAKRERYLESLLPWNNPSFEVWTTFNSSELKTNFWLSGAMPVGRGVEHRWSHVNGNEFTLFWDGTNEPVITSRLSP